MKKRTSLAILLLMFSISSFAAMLIGKVYDKDSQESLIGASVQIVGTNIGVITNIDGEFQIPEISLGKYDILIRYIGYNPIELKDFQVNNNESLNIELQSESLMLGDIEITGVKDNEAEQTLLVDRKKSVVALQNIGSKELIKKGISTAAGAVTKIAGISKQNNSNNISIRGLSDRYNQTTLNGFYLPSENPEYKNISLDFFQTDMIQAIEVNKVKSAQYSGDMTGANINILSKELIQHQIYKLKLGIGANTQSINKTLYSPSNQSYLSFNTLKLPSLENNTKYPFQNNLNPQKSNTPFNLNMGFIAGKKWLVGHNEQPLTVLIVGKLKNTQNFTKTLSTNSTTNGTVYKEMRGNTSNHKATQLLLGDITYKLNDKHSLSNHFIGIHSNTNEYIVNQGMRDDFNNGDGGLGQETRQQSNDHLMLTDQLQYNGELNDALTISSGIAFTNVQSKEPDRRINTLSQDETQDGYKWNYQRGDGKQQHYFSHLTEQTLQLKNELQYTFGQEHQHSVHLGYNLLANNTDFKANLFNTNIIKSSQLNNPTQDLDAFFNAENLSNNFFQLSQNEDKYAIKKWTHTAYNELNLQFNKWDIQAGICFEHINMQLDYALTNGGNTGQRILDENFILPNLNIKYTLNEQHAFRLGISKTYTLPQSKEIAPFRYYDIDFASEGNKNLNPSTNYNLDIKWDHNYGNSNLFAVTAFYKLISNPIARIDQANAAGVLTYANVSDQAQVSGLEIEWRQNLIGNSERKQQLSIGSNFSYIYSYCAVNNSGTTTQTGTQLEGAAPFIMNTDLTWNHTLGKWKLTQALIANHTSQKVYVVGMQGFADTMESSNTQLNFVSSACIGSHWKFKLTCTNLLDPKYELTRKDTTKNNQVLSSYRQGLTLQMGLSYTF